MNGHADPSDLHPTTLAVTSGRPVHTPDQPLNVPVTLASTYVAGGDLEYGRYANPTWSAFESALGALEGGRCLAFASGMAAAATVFDLVPAGGVVVAPRHAYNGSISQLTDLESRGRVRARLVDVTDPEALPGALNGAALVLLENPTNPALEPIDLQAAARAAHEAGALVAVDNTFATPLRQRPLDTGADIVIHSATKFIAGHSDLVMGALLSRDEEILADLKTRRDMVGAIPGPFEAWLALRGLRTLAVRLDRAEANARTLAARLAEHRAVREVRYPGFGAIISVVFTDAETADRLTLSTRLWIHATSLGGVESSFERRRRWQAEPATIPDALVRMAVGIEHVEDLWSDLDEALA